MTIPKEILEKIKLENKKNQKILKSPRFKKILGKLVYEGHLKTNQNIEANKNKIKLKDALWAGRYEPRILELLPSLVLKKKRIFEDLDDMPLDLKIILKDIKRDNAFEQFRGVPPEKYLYWISKIGHKNKKPSLLKSYRMKQEDIQILRELNKLGYNESEAIRLGIRLLLTKVS